MYHESILQPNPMGNKSCLKLWKNVFVVDVFFQDDQISKTEFSWNSKYGQRFIISKKFKYGTNTFLKLQPRKVGVFFQDFYFSCHNYRYSKIQIAFKVLTIKTSLKVQVKF